MATNGNKWQQMAINGNQAIAILNLPDQNKETKKLSVCEQYKHVFISPNRTKEECDEHWDLVKQLESKRNAELDKRFYI